MPDDDWVDPHRRLARLASWKLEWEPGSRFVYHGSSAHWVLAQLAESVTGTDFRTFVRDRPPRASAGFDSLCLGPAPGDQDDVLDVVGVGDAVSERPSSTSSGARSASTYRPSAPPKTDLLRHNDPEVRAVGQPGGGAVGRAADLAMYYQALLANPAELWQPDVLAAGTADVLCDLIDPMTGAPANRTLGLLLAGERRHGNDAGLRLHQLAAHVRTHGRRRAGVVGRSGHRIVVRLPDQWARPEPGAHGRPWPVAVLPSGRGGRSRSSRYMTSRFEIHRALTWRSGRPDQHLRRRPPATGPTPPGPVGIRAHDAR